MTKDTAKAFVHLSASLAFIAMMVYGATAIAEKPWQFGVFALVVGIVAIATGERMG